MTQNLFLNTMYASLIQSSEYLFIYQHKIKYQSKKKKGKCRDLILIRLTQYKTSFTIKKNYYLVLLEP
jgi:hypothetical protein